jgi:hypothetical protein
LDAGPFAIAPQATEEIIMSIDTRHIIDPGGERCMNCGATDLEAEADPECCGEDRWGIWCSTDPVPGWCKTNFRDGCWSRTEADLEIIKWRGFWPSAEYEVRRYPSPAPAAPAEAERWGVWCEKHGAKSGWVDAVEDWWGSRAHALNGVAYLSKYSDQSWTYSARPLPVTSSTVAPNTLNGIPVAANQAVPAGALYMVSGEWTPLDGDVTGPARKWSVGAIRCGNGKAEEWTGTEWRDIRKPVDAASIARALFVAECRCDDGRREWLMTRADIDLDRDEGEWSPVDRTRFDAVIVKAWERGDAPLEGLPANEPERTWRREATERAEAVVSEMGRKGT